MAKSQDQVAIAAVERIRVEADEAGYRRGYLEGYKTGWSGHAKKTAQALGAITMPPQAAQRAAKPKSSTKISKEYVDYQWPTDVSPSTKALPVAELDMDRLRGRIVHTLHAADIFTVGDLIDVPLQELVDRASQTTRTLGSVSVRVLLRALKAVGVAPIQKETVE